MKKSNWLAVLGMVYLTLTMAGCVVADRGPYHYDHGDRIDRYGHRDVGWCNQHHDDVNCR